jgi:ankyrin repeat protein
MSIFSAIKGNEIDRLGTLINPQNINTPDIVSGLTPLMYASKNDKLDSVKLLLEKGANINAQDTYGNTSLILATITNQVRIVKELIERGADVNIIAKNGTNAFSIAYKKEYTEIVKLLESNGAKVPAIPVVPDYQIKTGKYIAKLDELNKFKSNEFEGDGFEVLNKQSEDALNRQQAQKEQIKQEELKAQKEFNEHLVSNYNDPDFIARHNALVEKHKDKLFPSNTEGL